MSRTASGVNDAKASGVRSSRSTRPSARSNMSLCALASIGFSLGIRTGDAEEAAVSMPGFSVGLIPTRLCNRSASSSAEMRTPNLHRARIAH